MVATATQSQSAVGRLRAEKPHGLAGMIKNPYVFMTCAFAALGCLMYGYDQGVMSSVLVMESFQTRFPDLQGDTIQGWLVSALELGAWAGSLFNGWLAEKISRKYSMMVAVVIFTVGTGLQCGAYKGAELFAGRVIGGFGIGMFSMVIPLYQAEIAPPELRGSLVSLQQLSITIGTAIAFWLDYGMHFVGGTKCNPEGIPASEQYGPDGAYNYTLAAHHHCLGQEDVSWRFPLALQLLPAWILFVGMFFLPFSPRWLMSKHRDDDCIAALSKLRRLDPADPVLRSEYLEIKASVLFDEETDAELKAGGGALGSWKMLFAPNMLRRVMIGCMYVFRPALHFALVVNKLTAQYYDLPAVYRHQRRALLRAPDLPDVWLCRHDDGPACHGRHGHLPDHLHAPGCPLPRPVRPEDVSDCRRHWHDGLPCHCRRYRRLL